jgi:hypothetical protein
MDLFVVPTIGFDLLYAFVIVRLDRRDLVWINVTANPTAEWVARQITEAFPWDGAPRYMIRDRDRIYGAVVRRRLRAMGIRDKPIAPASPWQNGFAERLIGSIRREYLDHVIVLGAGSGSGGGDDRRKPPTSGRLPTLRLAPDVTLEFAPNVSFRGAAVAACCVGKVSGTASSAPQRH